MDKKKLQALIIGIPLFLAGFIFVYYKYLLSPLNEKQKVVKDDLATINKQYQDSMGRAARLPQLESEIGQLNVEIAAMQKKLPPNKDVPGLIRMLSRKMDAHNVVWTNLTPGKQTSKDYYIEHTYTIPFTTTYHNLAEFLADIGQMERIFATRFVSISPQIDEKTGIVRLKGEISFLIYTAKS